MRQLEKTEKPRVLSKNEARWREDYKADPKNTTKRYRYRHVEIKDSLKAETGNKCVYCESKIGHNTPGDVEHKVPSSKDITLHFDWANLTIACTECNRRKNDYYDEKEGFLDPYKDPVEELLVHLGPIVQARTGEAKAEIAVKTLQLSGSNRHHLVVRKIEKLEEMATLLERYQRETNAVLKGLIAEQLKEMVRKDAEYSAMVLTALKTKGFL